MYIFAKKTGCIPTILQNALNCAHTSMQRTQEHCERYFDRRLCMDRKKIGTGYYVHIDVSDGFTKTAELGHAGEKPYRVLGMDHHTVDIHRKGWLKGMQLTGS